MAFQIKDFASITASMLNWMRAAQRRVTDFEIGSIVRSMLEAVAQEIDQLYQMMFVGIREAIPVATYRTFRFEPLAASGAGGLIRVSITPISTDTLIPAGSVFSPVGSGTVQYVSTADTIIAATASFVDVAVSATSTGSAGNVVGGTTFTLTPQPLAFVSAAAPGGLSGGDDGETPDQRKARFQQYIASLERSTDRAVEYAATLANVKDASGTVIERVTSARVVNPWEVDPITYAPGQAWLYIENRVGDPSSALMVRCQQIIDGYIDPSTGEKVTGWKAAGVPITVKKATRTLVDVDAALVVATGYDATAIKATVSGVIFSYLSTLPVGATFYRSEVIARAKAVAGVTDIVLSEPAANIVPANHEKLAPGAITVT
ncbi:hypothetical protein EOD42_22385 [Rhodovarius crocodyli]|uniref:Uncharacterized protein n=1 Tax=Rhodovarius crocodyli TaxID=1979269 RepID=A0A437M1E1_9PROT|nr:baseplate J/gp47 family protein [Rhodovarius crocodyli]RVT91406.1 hypothetical protein EOD42_22385 [Rhodovarius crocodyli]